MARAKAMANVYSLECLYIKHRGTRGEGAYSSHAPPPPMCNFHGEVIDMILYAYHKTGFLCI